MAAFKRPLSPRGRSPPPRPRGRSREPDLLRPPPSYEIDAPSNQRAPTSWAPVRGPSRERRPPRIPAAAPRSLSPPLRPRSPRRALSPSIAAALPPPPPLPLPPPAMAGLSRDPLDDPLRPHSSFDADKRPSRRYDDSPPRRGVDYLNSGHGGMPRQGPLHLDSYDRLPDERYDPLLPMRATGFSTGPPHPSMRMRERVSGRPPSPPYGEYV